VPASSPARLRLTAALLLRMHQDSRTEEEQEAYGNSGFVNEAYE